jgi:hypothetical protein
MTRKWIAINVLMLLASVWLGWQVKTSVERFKAENNIAGIQPGKLKPLPDNAPPFVEPKKYGEAEYSAIYAQNLFSESRKLEDRTEAPPQPETRKLDIPPILVGVFIAGSRKEAMIIDPTTAAGNVRKAQTMHVGDNYRGFMLSDITDNSIVLEYGASREVIPLHDTSKPAQTGKTPILATRIVNFGGAQAGGAPGGTQTVLVAGQGTPSRGGAATQPAGRGGQTTVTPAQTQGNRAAGQGGGRAQPQVVTPPTTLYPNQYYDNQGNLVTSTIFGPMVTRPTTPVQTQQPPAKK